MGGSSSGSARAAKPFVDRRLEVDRTPLGLLVGFRHKTTDFPVLLMAVLSSRPEDFEAYLVNFEALMSNIGLGKGHEGEPPANPSKFVCEAPSQLTQPAEAGPTDTQPAVEPPAQPPLSAPQSTPSEPTDSSAPTAD